MKHLFFILALLFAILPVVARPAVPAMLPPSLVADSEVSTNISFTASLDVSLENFSVTPDGTAFIMR